MYTDTQRHRHTYTLRHRHTQIHRHRHTDRDIENRHIHSDTHRHTPLSFIVWFSLKSVILSASPFSVWLDCGQNEAENIFYLL